MSAKKTKISGQSKTAAGTSVDPEALACVAHQARNLLAFHLELGIAGYPATPELRQFMVNVRSPADRPNSPVCRETVDKKSEKPASAALEMETIARELADCRNCRSDRQHGTAIPGQGSIAPRLFVVGDCFSSIDNQKNMIWGAGEDELFWKMMAAIGLDRESVYVTNCIKCGHTWELQPDADLGRRCFPFLERELTAIEPALICTMGEMATSLLLKTGQPLVRMRGSFYQYRYAHGSVGRVMPTFHPRFLLKNPEMKRAAWLDLQAVQRQLHSEKT